MRIGRALGLAAVLSSVALVAAAIAATGGRRPGRLRTA
jgi:hypothetical protein